MMSPLLFSKNLTFSDFQNILLEILNSSAPVKNKNFGFNHNPLWPSLLEKQL